MARNEARPMQDQNATDDVHPEYHGLTRCPFCGREKEASWLTCSRPSCEQEMLEREGM